MPFDLSCKKKFHDNVLLAWKIDENADIVKFQVVMNENIQLIDTQLNQILIESNFLRKLYVFNLTINIHLVLCDQHRFD